MKACRALIVSPSPLFADAISLMLKAEHVIVVAAVSSLDEAKLTLLDQPIDTIIVDHDSSQLQDFDIISHLIHGNRAGRAVFLTMAGNQMIVHHREQVENVTPADFVNAIRSSRAH